MRTSTADSEVLKILKRRIYYGKGSGTKLSDLQLASKEILDLFDKELAEVDRIAALDGVIPGSSQSAVDASAQGREADNSSEVAHP